MSTKEFLNKVRTIASQHKLVNSTSISDVYEEWNGGDVKYPAVDIALENVTVNTEESIVYNNIVLYYGDRLTQDKSNITEIQSDAIRVLNSIINNTINLEEVGFVNSFSIELWEQKFNDYLAGGYVKLSVGIQSELGDCALDLYDAGETTINITLNGTYDVADYTTANVSVYEKAGVDPFFIDCETTEMEKGTFLDDVDYEDLVDTITEGGDVILRQNDYESYYYHNAKKIHYDYSESTVYLTFLIPDYKWNSGGAANTGIELTEMTLQISDQNVCDVVNKVIRYIDNLDNFYKKVQDVNFVVDNYYGGVMNISNDYNSLLAASSELVIKSNDSDGKVSISPGIIWVQNERGDNYLSAYNTSNKDLVYIQPDRIEIRNNNIGQTVKTIIKRNEITIDGNKVATESYVTSAIAGITQFNYSVVTDLPSTGVKGTIYLKAKTDGETLDVFDEYLWIENKWELIGNTKVDLSDYVMKTAFSFDASTATLNITL